MPIKNLLMKESVEIRENRIMIEQFNKSDKKLSDLSNVIILKIFSYCSPKSLCRLSKVNQKFHYWATQDSLWERTVKYLPTLMKSKDLKTQFAQFCIKAIKRFLSEKNIIENEIIDLELKKDDLVNKELANEISIPQMIQEVEKLEAEQNSREEKFYGSPITKLVSHLLLVVCGYPHLSRFYQIDWESRCGTKIKM